MIKARLLMIICIVIVIIQLFSYCENQNRQSFHEKVQGHWHMKSPYHFTLDVEDSIVKFNKYSFSDYSDDFFLYDSVDGVPVFPVPCGCGGGVYPLVRKFQLTNDSLIYADSIVVECSAYSPIKFVKSDPKQCKWSHVFADWSGNVRLENFPASTSAIGRLDTLDRKNAVAAIAVGFPLEYEQFGDDPVILAHDVFIASSDLPLFLEKEHERDGRGYPLVVCLIVDKSVPAGFVEAVIAAIPEKSVDKIFQVVSSTGEIKIGYQRIR